MKNFLKLFSAALIGLACANFSSPNLSAQQTDDPEIVEPQAAEPAISAPMIFQSTEDLSDGSSQTTMSVIAASDSDGAMFFSNGGGAFTSFSPMGSDSFSLLNNRSIQKDLELVDDQMESIREIQKEFSKKIHDQMGDLSKDGFDPSKMAGLKDIIADIQNQKKEEINKLLLPHQQARLKQVALQMKMKSKGTSNALTSDAVVEALGITEDQVEELKNRAKELEKEIAEKTKQLKDDAKQELIGVLSPTQQTKLEEMMGDQYTPDPNDWRSRLPERMRSRIQKSSDQ